jgi:hypothetical protein
MNEEDPAFCRLGSSVRYAPKAVEQFMRDCRYGGAALPGGRP